MYDFGALLLPGSDGYFVEPPVYEEGDDVRRIASDGQAAALTQRHIRRVAPEHFVLQPRTWRDYLDYKPDAVQPVNPILLPTAEEKKDWDVWVAQGWAEGLVLAESIYQTRQATLDRDFTGMILFHRLHEEGLVSTPILTATNRGVTGNGDELRIGDLEVNIRQRSVLQPNTKTWHPQPYIIPDAPEAGAE